MASSLALIQGPSIGGIVSAVDKWFGLAKDAKEVADANSWYNYWNTMQQYHLGFLYRDEGQSTCADSLRVGVDHARSKLDQAEMGYYASKAMMTTGNMTGGILIPDLSAGVLMGLQAQISAAAQELAWEEAAYNNYR